MIKILHFISDTNIGGAGKLLCEQIKGLDHSKFDITVALPHGSALVDELSSLPCKIIQFNHGSNQSFSIKNVIESIEIIKKLRPDIVHSHGSLSSRIAATILKIPCRIFTRHCAPPIPKIFKNPLAKRCYGTINNLLSTYVVATAECVKRDLIEMGLNEQKIATIINGVSPLRPFNEGEKAFLRAKYGLNDENFVISIVARLEEGKGHKTLLEAAKICKDRHPNFRFFIVGTGNFEQNLKNYATSLGICDMVHFTGFQEDVTPIFNITDVNVNCSYVSETASLSLSEGMSLGIPCVVTDIGGNTYMVKNEKNGLVIPCQNPQTLANEIIKLYKDEALYKKCSLGALARYREELNDKIMCKKMTNFYLREYRKSKNPTHITKIRPHPR